MGEGLFSTIPRRKVAELPLSLGVLYAECVFVMPSNRSNLTTFTQTGIVSLMRIFSRSLVQTGTSRFCCGHSSAQTILFAGVIDCGPGLPGTQRHA